MFEAANAKKKELRPSSHNNLVMIITVILAYYVNVNRNNEEITNSLQKLTHRGRTMIIKHNNFALDILIMFHCDILLDVSGLKTQFHVRRHLKNVAMLQNIASVIKTSFVKL